MLMQIRLLIRLSNRTALSKESVAALKGGVLIKFELISKIQNLRLIF